MKNKHKHNKKRNSIFLYEALMRELTKSIVKEDFKRKNYIVKVLKEYFKKGSLLSKEVEMYKTLLETKDLTKPLAEKLLVEVKKEHNSINKKKLFEDQSKLIKTINKELSSKILSNFVPNYKNLATIYQVLNVKLAPKQKVMLEEEIINTISLGETKEENKNLKPISNLAYKTFVKKFNDKYGKGLLKEQNDLLNRYITSFSDDGIELKIYLNEELGRLKQIVSKSLKLDEVKEDKEMIDKTNGVLKLMEGYKEKPINVDMLEEVLKIQELAKEIEEDAN